MIVEIVTFKALPGADWKAILADARTTIPRWRANRELKRKHYVLSADCKTAGGVYIWSSRGSGGEGPRRHLARHRRKAYGRGAPTIVYFDLMMHLDNEAGIVTECQKQAKKHAVSMV